MQLMIPSAVSHLATGQLRAYEHMVAWLTKHSLLVARFPGSSARSATVQKAKNRGPRTDDRNDSTTDLRDGGSGVLLRWLEQPNSESPRRANPSSPTAVRHAPAGMAWWWFSTTDSHNPAALGWVVVRQPHLQRAGLGQCSTCLTRSFIPFIPIDASRAHPLSRH